MRRTLTLLVSLAVAVIGLQASAAMYIVGDAPFGGWKTNAGLEMTAAGNNTYTAEADIVSTAYFVFATRLCSTADDWATFGNYRLGPVSNGTVVAPGAAYTAYSGQGSNSFVITAAGHYSFTFDGGNNTFTVAKQGAPGPEPTVEHLYILGEAGGNAWDPSSGIEMATADGNVFTAANVVFNGEHAADDANVSYFSFTAMLADASDDWAAIEPYRLTPVSDGDFWVTVSTLGSPIGLNAMGTNTSAAFRIPAGTYDITVNIADRTAVITGHSAPPSGRGWPANYGGVMLQGFYWDSYDATRWTALTDRAQELSQAFDIIWVPNSASVDASGTAQTMGYVPVYWLRHNSCFGTQAQLVDMIQAFKRRGTSIMGDVVINHKAGRSGWVDFPNESVTGPVTGDTYSLSWSLADICSTDECTAAGYAASGAPDEGEDFDGARDLDHTRSNVQNNCKAYTKFLIDELGYDGFRYDMSKGYAAYYTGMYNAYSQPTFSVGEYWDGNANTLRWWLDGTKVDGAIQSAVFDFSLKYPINSAFNGNWSALNDKGLSADPNYQRYAVTFIDNHDTGRNNNYDCLKNNVMAANAFILAMPGTPCILYKHYNAYTEQMTNCIRARRAAGVHNQSPIVTQQESNGGYIIETQGTRGSLYLQLGGATSNGTPSGYSLVQSGDNYRLYITSGIDWRHVGKSGAILGYPVVSKPAGTYAGSVTLTVAPSKPGTTLVYTLDGTVPDTASTAVTASTSLTLDESATLRVGVLHNGLVENVEDYVYTIAPEAPQGISVYVKSSMAGASVWAWKADGTSVTGSSWPGTKISALDKVIVNDTEWYRLHADADELNVIFNNGDGGFENQTATINCRRDMFFIYPDGEMTGFNYDAADTYLDVTPRNAGASGGSALFDDVYVLGNINSRGWAADNGLAMTTANGERYTATVTFAGPANGYSYFSFSTALAASASDWTAIAGKRMGAAAQNYPVTEDNMGTPLPVVAGDNSFRIATGKYNLTLYLSAGKLVVEKYVEPLRGDIDGNGEVDPADISALIDHLLNGAPVVMTNADCDNNGAIDASDISSLIDYLLNGNW